MTQPTDRPGINQITSDELDQLYARLEKAGRAVDHLTDRYRGAEAEVQQWRDTYGEHALRDALVRLERADRAGATLTAVRELVERAEKAHAAGHSDYDIGKYNLATRLLAVLDQHGQTPA